MEVIIGHLYKSKSLDKVYVLTGAGVSWFKLAADGITMKFSLKKGSSVKDGLAYAYTYVGAPKVKAQ